MNENKEKNPWQLKKLVLPQHTDHAGVMWHGSYLNWLEEARINAISSVGLEYKDISNAGFEMPVVELKVRYLLPIFNGAEVMLESFFSRGKGPRWRFDTNFIKDSSKLVAIANVDLVVINKNSFSVIRKNPDYISKALINLQKGP